MNKRQGVSVVLRKPSGKILMQQRDGNTKCYPFKWCFPGGGLDPNESHEQTAIREVGEECAVVVDRANLKFAFAFDHDGYKCDHFFVVDVHENLEAECHEGLRVEWKTIEEIARLDLADWLPGAVVLLESFLKNWRSPYEWEV